jgi:hypothetical protein
MIGGPGSANPTGGSRSNRCQGGSIIDWDAASNARRK